MPLPQRELHGDLDDDGDRCPKPSRRREASLPYRVDRLLVESGPETAQYSHVPNAAIWAHHDLQ